MGRFFRIIKFILFKILNGIKDFIIHLISRILFFITQILFFITCDLIFVVTFEPGTWKRATKRKIRRIRALTKLKLYAWKYCEPYFKFIGDDVYLEKLYNNFGFLIEKNK